MVYLVPTTITRGHRYRRLSYHVTVLLTRKDPTRRACVLAKGYSRGECRRHRFHSKHQNHKGTRRPKTRAPTQTP